MAKESRIPFVNGQRGSFFDYLILSTFIAIFSILTYRGLYDYRLEHGRFPVWADVYNRAVERHTYLLQIWSSLTGMKP